LVNAGTYTLSEQTVAKTTRQHVGCGNNTVTNGPSHSGSREQRTCTINNDDVASHLTLVKTITNDNGGFGNPRELPLTATGPSTISARAAPAR
jgi:hypothetical protein